VTDLANQRRPHRTGKSQAIQEALCGFLLDKVINSKGEFYADHRISIGQLYPNRGEDDDED
jgi:hypothetical protein